MTNAATPGVQASRRHGKPLDVMRLKRPVLDDLAAHVREVATMARYLAEKATRVPQGSCYVCASSSSEPMATIQGFDYVRCRDCDHVYTTHRYGADDIERFYRENEYYSRITYANAETCHYRRDHVARPKVEFAESCVGRPPGQWLDVGSGIGDIVSVLAEHGWRVDGLELSERSVAFAKETFGVELHAELLETYAARVGARGAVDVLSFFAILEHVPDPMSLLRLAHDLVRPDGYLVVQVPNANSVASMIQSVFPEHVFRHMSPISHIMLFTERSLTRALRVTGFEPVAWWFLGLDVYELLNTLVLVNPRVQGSPLQAAILARMNELQQVFDSAETSDGIICVARRTSAEGATADA